MTDRIPTTHVGSLPRPERLVKLMHAKESGGSYSAKDFADAVSEAVDLVVKRQVDLGIDIVDDGEQSKSGFVAYVNERLDGFEPYKNAAPASAWAGTREALAFPEFYARQTFVTPAVRMLCTGPIKYAGHKHLQDDIQNLKRALEKHDARRAFMPSASPASIEGWNPNGYYRTSEEYLFAAADAMRVEYRTIIDAGLELQIDDPWLAMHYTLYPDADVQECRRWAEIRVEALNHALRGIPEEKVRHHTCYGINMGPRVHELGMDDLADVVLKIKAGTYSFEAANPRHEHEWRIWERLRLPEGKKLMPGVITHTSVLVEHPELVAERLGRFAKLVGKENLIAGADCGFASHPSVDPEIHPSIVWAKLESLVEGARLASDR